MKLMDDEKVYYELKPHFLSQFGEYFFSFFAIIFCSFWLFREKWLFERLAQITSESWFIKTLVKGILACPKPLVWAIVLLIIALIQALAKIRFKSLIGVVVLLLICVGCQYYWPAIPALYNKIMLGVSILLVVGLELQRASTKYIVTDQRIILRRIGLKDTMRTLFYGKIQDLYISKSLFGKMFNYGTIIPITASQLGTGAVDASVSMGVGGGAGPIGGGAAATFGHSQTTVAESHEYTLFCIPDVEEVYNCIVGLISHKNQ